MEHAPILPAGPTAPFAAFTLPEPLQGALAVHALRSLANAPITEVALLLANLPREHLSATIDAMIAVLDHQDGDPDIEADDHGGEPIAIVDDPDNPPEDSEVDPDLEQTMDEDDWCVHAADGPGCPVSDPGGAGALEDDEPDGTGEGDTSWTEWHTRGRNKLHDGIQGRNGWSLREDDELIGDECDVAWCESSDWDASQSSPMRVGAAHEDAEEDDHPGTPADEDDPSGYRQSTWHQGPGCPIADPGGCEPEYET